MIHGRSGRLTLVALYGSGDAYLVCALAKAVEAQRARPVVVVVKDCHAAVAALFGDQIKFELAADATAAQIEGDTEFHRTYENRMDFGRAFFVHPHFIRSGVRIDRLALKPAVSHADMFRAMLQLDPDEPLTEPLPRFRFQAAPKTALIFPTARSWPNSKPEFWAKLAARLRDMGWTVQVDVPSRNLSEIFDACTKHEWVIGPQRGLTSILTMARFPCRKTIITPSIDGGRYPGLPLKTTFPYAYVTKFAGVDHDVEEFKIGDDIDAAVDNIARGKNAFQIGGIDPKPVMSISVDLSPGEFFDRLSILEVKRHRFSPERWALVDRDYRRLVEIADPILGRFREPLADAFDRLTAANLETFDQNDIKVAASVAGSYGPSFIESHAAADRASLRRMEIKREINILCGAAFNEVKSYGGDS